MLPEYSVFNEQTYTSIALSLSQLLCVIVFVNVIVFTWMW